MKFQVKAFRRDTGVTALDIEASDIGEAERLVRAEGYHALKISGERAWPFDLFTGFRQSTFPLLMFCEELTALNKAGLSLIEAIDGLHRRPANPLVGRVVDAVRKSLHEGRTLSSAMASMPEHFPELLVASIRSSEETGNLSASLDRYINYRKQIDGLRDKIVAASLYPLLLLIVGGLIVIFLLGYVVPRFSRVFEGVGNDLPYLSRLLMDWGAFAAEHTLLLTVSFIGMVALIGYLLSRKEVRQQLTNTIWRIPVIGDRLRVYQLARMTRTLAMLLIGGIPLVKALEMTQHLLNQTTLQEGLSCATHEIREGLSATEAFGRHGLASEVGLQMLAVGERSGELGTMLENLANFYDLQNERFVAWSTRLIEPLFMAGIGVVVGVIVLLMYFPIFELAGNLG